MKIKDKLKKILPAGAVGLGTLLIVLNVSFIANSGFFKQYKVKNDPKFDGITEYLKHSDFDVPLTFPVDKNTPITIAVNNFSEADQLKVFEAIDSFDKISENINFQISDGTNVSISSQINIYGNSTADVFGENPRHLGCTSFTYNAYTGEISYPVNIYVKPLDDYSFVTEYTLPYIIKHELMHGFGFEDLYDQKYENQSIMYHEMNYNTNINDYTDLDKANIQQLYDNKKIQVKRPTQFQIIYKKPEEYEMI